VPRNRCAVQWSASKCWALLAITWLLPIMPAGAKSTRHKQKCRPEIPTVSEFVRGYEVSQWHGAGADFAIRISSTFNYQLAYCGCVG
jgi:hypothetical protein